MKNSPPLALNVSALREQPLQGTVGSPFPYPQANRKEAYPGGCRGVDRDPRCLLRPVDPGEERPFVIQHSPVHNENPG